MTSASEAGMSRFFADMPASSQRNSGSRSRAQSISSDRPSTAAQSIMSPPLSVSPEPAFIAASAASQIATNDHDSRADTWYDQHGFQPSGESVVVSPPALHQLNGFLDYFLFNFIGVARSTSISALRLAVAEVLKPKLAKDAINNADEELREYLGGGDDEEFLQSPARLSDREWDVELVWKRTRLRCMVYSSLGDMEEEDEDHHMEEGLLSGQDEPAGANVSPAVAIFLTSILEYLGEQALLAAGQAAWNRLRVRYEKQAKDGVKGRADIVERVVIDEIDMERVALDRTLGRLWRAWKKRVRSGPGSVDLSYRPMSRDRPSTSRLGSVSSADSYLPPVVQEHPSEPDEVLRTKDEARGIVDYTELAAAIPLPVSERDVDEIEVPGLVHYSDDESESEESERLDLSMRPKSLMILPLTSRADLPTPTKSQPHTPTRTSRKRANSLPTPAGSPHKSPEKREKTNAAASESNEAAQHTVPAKDVDSQTAVAESVQAPRAEAAKGESNMASDFESNKHAGQPRSEPSVETVASAAAAALAGVGAVSAKSTSKKQASRQSAPDDDSEYEEIEEAQILTSSRISIGGSISGRSDSPANSDRSGRPPLSIHTLPVRSGSLRLVDVSSPRTPSARSLKSAGFYDQNISSSSRSGTASRASSVHTPTHLEDQREADDQGVIKVSNTGFSGKTRSRVGQSISEVEEHAEARAEHAPGPTATISSPSEIPTVPETIDEDVVHDGNGSQHTQPLFGSVKRHPSPPKHSPTGNAEQRSQQRSPRSQTAAAGAPPETGTFLDDDVGPLRQRYPRPPPRQYGSASSPTGPPVPEKNSGRYHQHGQSQSQPGTIGLVSVDRSYGQKDNGETTRPSMDQATIRPTMHTPHSSMSSSRMRAARVSQDSTSARPEDVARNFEELIRGNETIQYTLTPENMRDIEARILSLKIETKTNYKQGSPKPAVGWKAETNRDRSGSATVHKPVEITRSASITRATGLRSHPVEFEVDQNEKSHPPVSMANRARGAAPQARDPRVPRESISEFAEFIRATGPPGAESAAPTKGLRRNGSVLRNDGPPPAPSSKMSIDQGRPARTGSVSRARLQARDATVENENDNSDLIDFIRRGPPSSGNPRIPRTVAPFRTTMDSDQLTAAVGGKAMDASLPDIHDTRYSQGSTNVTDMSAPSMSAHSTQAPSIQSSVNSQSALLGRMQATAQSANPFDEPDMMPVRKQRRVRDPYAIDFSDEEDDDFDDDMPPQPSRRAQPKEESLIDFLRDAAPPPQTEPVPFNIARTQTTPTQPQSAPKKKASAPSLMARFRQNSSSASSGTRGPKSPTGSRSVSSRAGPPSSSASKGYIPIQVNIPTGGDLFPTYGSSPSAPAVPPIPSNYSSRPSGRVPMKKFEPRDAVNVPSRGTSDLADFLRDSEPPPAATPAYAESSTEANVHKLFGRRKKSTGFA